MGSKKNSLEATSARLADGNFIQRAIADVKLAYWLMRQPDVSLLYKLVPIVAVLYVLAPIDVIPDLVPVLGQVDDAAFVMLGVRLFLHLAPPAVIGRYEAAQQTSIAAPEKPEDAPQ
jgi:uncharacterized membrane protein YkvA (DUF1232 family)